MIERLNNEPVVSIIICSYNHANFLPDALNSILYQDYPNIEIVVVDDGSTDNTAEVISKYTSVKYIYKSNAGLAAARNTGISKCIGDFILFLDADDWLLPGAVSINLNFLLENPTAAFVSGGHISVNPNGDIISIEKQEVHSKHFEHLLKFNYIGMHATVLYRRWALDFYMFDTSLTGCDDYDSYLGIAAHHTVIHHTVLLAAYRKHNNNMSSDYTYMLNTTVAILHKHIAYLKDPYLIALGHEGIVNWRGYYASKQWNLLLNMRFLDIKNKVKSLTFINATNPKKVKSYIYGNYRRLQIKSFITGLLFYLKSKKTINTLKKVFPEKIFDYFFHTDLKNVKQTEATILTLMYHRVANTICDPWHLCVSPQNFEAHLKWLKEENIAISLTELEAILNGEKLESYKVLLTFDDGYTDNFTIVKPLLEKYKLPAIFFLASKSLGKQYGTYYWDVLQNIFLEKDNLPSTFSLNIYKGFFTLNIHEEERLKTNDSTLNWSAGSKAINSRTNAFFKLSILLNNMHYDDVQKIINQLVNQCGTTLSNLELPKIADAEMLKNIKNHPYIIVGAHTVTHTNLPIQNKLSQIYELAQSKNDLELFTNTNILTFAYPDGQYSEKTLEYVKETGYKLAFTTKQQSINSNDKLLEIGRFQINNWDAQLLKRKILLWRNK